MPPKRPDTCSHENCNSRRFREGDDGFTYCDRGHQQAERGALTTEDQGDIPTLGRRARRRDTDAESAVSREPEGLTRAQALELYLLCLQLTLRKQVRWLVEVQKLPDELEVLVRDLWTLRLQQVTNSTSSHINETGTDTEGGYSSSSQVFSSQSDGEESSSGTTRTSTSRRKLKPSRRKENSPSLVDALALTYIGILLLRIPVTVQEIQRWVNDGKLLYYRAAKELPLDMRERLPPSYQSALQPLDLLKPEWLHRAVQDTLRSLHEKFGMVVPPINHVLLLHRWMKELYLPIEVFAATQRLAQLLDLEFGFAATVDPAGHTMPVVVRYPEVRLMAVLLAATKLVFPFDRIKRYPRNETDLAAMSLDWDRWAEIHGRTDHDAKMDDRERGRNDGGAKEQQLAFHQAFLLNEQDCLDASNERLDQYLDWYEDNMASEELRSGQDRSRRERDMRQMLFEVFPLDKRDTPPPPPPPPPLPPSQEEEEAANEGTSAIWEQSTDVKTRGLQSALHPLRAISEAEAAGGGRSSSTINRPGSYYKRFRSAAELTRPAKTLFQLASGMAGISIEKLVKAVFWVDTKIVRKEEVLRRAES